MTAMTDASFEAIMLRLQTENMKMIKQMMEEMKVSTTKGQSMVDTRGIGKPPSFDGKEENYYEWMAKLLAYLRVIKKESDTWIIWANGQTVTVSENQLDLKFGEHTKEVKDF